MCLIQPATVLAAGSGDALVDVDGRRLSVLSPVVADLAPGDDVVVGLGIVLGRVSAAEGRELRALRRQALGANEPPSPRPHREARLTGV